VKNKSYKRSAKEEKFFAELDERMRKHNKATMEAFCKWLEENKGKTCEERPDKP
jgi:hypothetical protein